MNTNPTSESIINRKHKIDKKMRTIAINELAPHQHELRSGQKTLPEWKNCIIHSSFQCRLESRRTAIYLPKRTVKSSATKLEPYATTTTWELALSYEGYPDNETLDAHLLDRTLVLAQIETFTKEGLGLFTNELVLGKMLESINSKGKVVSLQIPLGFAGRN